MNKEIKDFARIKIKEGLKVLPEGHQDMFRRMYSYENLDRPIDEIVDSISVERLNMALTQVNNSLNKMSEK